MAPIICKSENTYIIIAAADGGGGSAGGAAAVDGGAGAVGVGATRGWNGSSERKGQMLMKKLLCRK